MKGERLKEKDRKDRDRMQNKRVFYLIKIITLVTVAVGISLFIIEYLRNLF